MGKSSAKRGRPGLSYWEILVLAAARLGCSYDYDQLQDLAENHRALRQVMGIGDWESAEQDEKRFDWRRIESNVNLLRPETIAKINRSIIEEGHRLEPQAAETVRGDSLGTTHTERYHSFRFGRGKSGEPAIDCAGRGSNVAKYWQGGETPFPCSPVHSFATMPAVTMAKSIYPWSSQCSMSA